MKKLLLLLCAAPLALCAQRPFTIEGSAKGLNPSVDSVYISYASNGENVLDGVSVSNGKYKFQGTVTQPTRVDLKAVYKNGTQSSMSRDLITLFIEPATVTVNSVDSFSNATVSGSSANVEFQKLKDAAKSFQPKTAALLTQIAQYKKDNDEDNLMQSEKQMDALDAQMKETVYATYIRQNPNSMLSFFALQQFSGATMQNPQESLELFNLLPQQMKMSHDGQRMHSLITRSLQSSVGKPAIDFTQTDMNGNAVTLSSFKGKTVLLNFWASWCGPCRALDAGLVKLYNKYKDNNFTIINISLDKPGAKQDWLKAIHDDGLDVFTQVTDLRFWNNAVAQQYGIATMPQNVLINTQGIIVAKDLKSNELDRKIQSLVSGEMQD